MPFVVYLVTSWRLEFFFYQRLPSSLFPSQWITTVYITIKIAYSLKVQVVFA